MIIPLKDISLQQRQHWLQHAIGPRPIALVSTINEKGQNNLAPFSFFNLVSTDPPLVIFSPSRRVRDNSTKHTLENLYGIPEAVIHIVTAEMVQQTSLASCDYPEGVDEFVKAGFTRIPATKVKPGMVKESPVKLECRINHIQPLGQTAGAGNLVIAEVLVMHVEDAILNESGSMIDQHLLPHVARLGGDWYCTVKPENMFAVPKPNSKLGIGIDQLPPAILSSGLDRNELAMLANTDKMPQQHPAVISPAKLTVIKTLLKENNIEGAWSRIND